MVEPAVTDPVEVAGAPRGLPSWARFSVRAALFVVGLLILDNVVLGSCLLPFLCRYRPPMGADNCAFAQGQLARVEQMSEQPTAPKVVFIGSSSVVNGVDVGIIANVWGRAGLRLAPMNYGVTGCVASELPLMRRYLLRADVKAVVYLYNTFSFCQALRPPSTRSVWNTREFLRFARVDECTSNLPAIGAGLLNEAFFCVRYQSLIQDTLRRWSSHGLRERGTDFDYPLQGPAGGRRERRLEEPLAPTEWGRQVYVSSDTDEETLGYRALARFLEVARQGGVAVIVMPVPEPEFASWGRYRQGVSLDRIDRHVARLCQAGGAMYIDRRDTRCLEETDELFIDHAHLHWKGRDVYSLWLARRLEGIVGGAAAPSRPQEPSLSLQDLISRLGPLTPPEVH